MTERIVVIDFGAQYNQLIARRVREAGVYSELLPCTASLEQIRGEALSGIILSGGPDSVYWENARGCDPGLFALGVPVLGICSIWLCSSAARSGPRTFESLAERRSGLKRIRCSMA